MAKRPRTPAEIAKQKRAKKNYSFSLIRSNVEALVELANGVDVPISELVDEAIEAYLESLREREDEIKKT